MTGPDLRRRALFFRMGVAIGVDASEADPAAPFRATLEAGLYLVRVAGERYEVPEAVVYGR